MPPTKPQVTNSERERASARRIIMNLDASRRRRRTFGSVTVSTPSRRSAVIASLVDGVGELEGPREACRGRARPGGSGRPGRRGRRRTRDPRMVSRLSSTASSICSRARPGHLRRDHVAIARSRRRRSAASRRSRAGRRDVRAVPAMREDREADRRAYARIVARDNILRSCAPLTCAPQGPMASIQATRLKKGMLIKIGTTCSASSICSISRPATSAASSRRRCATSAPASQATTSSASEEDVERAMLDEREMQYLYSDGDSFHFMDTTTYEQLHIDVEVLGDDANYLIADATIRVEFYDERAGRHRAAARRWISRSSTRCRASRARPPARRSSRRRSKPAWSSRCRRSSTSATRAGQHRDRRVSEEGLKGGAESDPAGFSIDIQLMDVQHRAGGGLDRSHRRQHVQRQERGADPPPAPRADRQAQGPDLQAADRRPLRRRPHHLAQRDADRRRRTSAPRASCSIASSPTPKWSASTRGSSSTPSCRRSAARWPIRASGVIVAGLDQDYLGKPFEPMPQLLAIAEYITKTLAICMVCGAPANHTQRLVASSERVLVGAQGHLRGALPPLFRSAARAVKSVPIAG